MKAAYIGEPDALTSAVLERMKKEAYEVFFLTKAPNGRRSYALPQGKEDMKRVLAAIAPDVVIYEGEGFLDEAWDDRQKTNLSLLTTVLDECCCNENLLFCMFSSVEVYGRGQTPFTEDDGLRPVTCKGLYLSEEEQMVELYHTTKGLRRIILRLSDVFSDEFTIGTKDVFGNLAAQIHEQSEIVFRDDRMQPVHVRDVSDAVVRVLQQEKETVYNVCGSQVIQRSDIADYLVKKLDADTKITVTEQQMEVYDASEISNERIKKEQEWTEFWPMADMLKKNRISVIRSENKKKQQKRHILRSGIRRTLENIVIFAVFFILYFLTRDHSLFSQVDWLLIYVVVVSLVYGVKQSTVAVVLSSVLYLALGGDHFQQMTNFYSYAQNILVIVEFLFLGIVVGYTVDTMREENRIGRMQFQELAGSYEKLKEIDDKNILLKNEYERRVLDAKTSMPRLYSVIRRINVLDINRIFMEVITVIHELLHTDTVAVYRAAYGSDRLRLIASLNKESVMGGKSWDLNACPKIMDAIRNDTFYEGDIWSREPALVVPASSTKGCEAVIVIRELSLETQSLYYINLLRTLLALLSDSIEKALQYDQLTHDQKYVGDTEILKPEEFKKEVSLAEEKKQQEMAEYCMLRFEKQDMTGVYHSTEKLFREMDIWGCDADENLYVLLENTSAADADIVLERLKNSGFLAEKIAGL